jgi:hypothetical protein
MLPHQALAMHRRHIDETRALLDRHDAEHLQLRIASKGMQGAAHHAMVKRHNAEYEALKGRHAAEARGETGSYKPRSAYWQGQGGLSGRGGEIEPINRHAGASTREERRTMGDAYSTMK